MYMKIKYESSYSSALRRIKNKLDNRYKEVDYSAVINSKHRCVDVIDSENKIVAQVYPAVLDTKTISTRKLQRVTLGDLEDLPKSTIVYRPVATFRDITSYSSADKNILVKLISDVGDGEFLKDISSSL